VTDSSLATTQVIQALTTGRMWSRAEVLSGPSIVPDTSGIYGWYFRDLPAAELLTGCVQRHGLSLLYVGIAPKHASSASTLRKRIVENHFKARRGLSTLRLTLALLLGLETRHTKSCNVVPTPQSQQRLSEWMSDHAFVVWTTAKAPWILEKLVISQLRPPLNLLGANRAHPFYLHLKGLRHAARAGRRRTHSDKRAVRRPMIEPLVIEHEGRPMHVLLPFADWERIRRILEDAEDLEAVRRVESDPNQDHIPLEVVRRLVDDENPLKVWREYRGLTQQALAHAAGLRQSTIARLESGERKGTLAQMRRLTHALGITLDTLCGA
jgi:DNA-binding XRE family transcriptional regulator